MTLSDDLFARARALEALADDIEPVMDLAATCASSPEWECPNATDVRGTIGQYRRAATSAAHTLRQEAATVRSQAREQLKEEKDASAAAAQPR